MELENKRKLYDNPTLFTLTDRDNRLKCECNHTIEFWHGEDKVLCSHCGRFVFKNKKCEFNYFMKKQFAKNNK